MMRKMEREKSEARRRLRRGGEIGRKRERKVSRELGALRIFWN